MRVIITGGTGLIGKELAASLAADKHEVILLTRNPKSADRLPSGVRAEKWDGRTANGWGGLAEGAGAIVNLAGESIAGQNPLIDRWTESRKQVLLNSRLDAGKAVTEAIRAAAQKPAVLVQSSAVGYYGPCGDEEVPETHPAGKDYLAKLCVQWEASTAEVEAMGVRRAVIRTGLPLSTHGGFFPPVLMLWKFFVGGPLGGGNHYWPWLHMADQVTSIRFIIDNPNASGAINISAPNPVRQKDFGKVLGKVLGRPSIMPTPGFALRLMMGELAESLLLSGQRELPTRLEQMGFQFKFPQLEPALRDTLK